MKSTFTYILATIAGIIAGILLCRQCSFAPINCDDCFHADSTTTRIDSQAVYDTTFTTLPGRDSIKVIHDTAFIPAQVDTPAVIADYFAKRQYNFDFTRGDVRLSGKLNVQQNRLDTTQLKIYNYRATEQSYYSAKIPRWRLYAGVIAGKNMAAPGFRVQYKRLSAGLHYNLISNINNLNVEQPQLMLSLDYELWKGRYK